MTDTTKTLSRIVEQQMKSDLFIKKDFLLNNDTARELYHDFAADMPILDYHGHLPPEQIARNTRFRDLTHIWLEGDHYKWRAMRSNGLDEKFTTGAAEPWEKFEKWAETVPSTLRNPLYHWTHMELKKPFGIGDRLLNKETAKGIWEACNAQLQTDEFRVRGLLKQFKVRLVCTTDDPVDSLEHHKAVQTDLEFPVQMLPAWRPDKVLGVNDHEAFNEYLDKLSEVSDVAIRDLDSLMDALRVRHDFFHEMGCRLSDHGMEVMYSETYSNADVNLAFDELRAGKSIGLEQQLKLRSFLLYEMAKMDCDRDWTQQFHLGALRNVNTRYFNTLGPDVGGDVMGDFPQARALCRFLGRLDAEDKLARTVLFNLNPADNDVFATIIGAFQKGPKAGKMQVGPGWWFNDQIDGMSRQMESLSNMGLLARFIGMTTDSRSFLSFSRHEYFRRLLCAILAGDIENGYLPRDMKLIGSMIQDICYNNAKNYFEFGLKDQDATEQKSRGEKSGDKKKKSKAEAEVEAKSEAEVAGEA